MKAYRKYRPIFMLVIGGVFLGMVFPAVAAVPADEPKQLTTTQAVILGIVEGLTEYLPISSTGHLLVTKDLLGMHTAGADMARQATETDAINAYLVCIQFGAILAILFVFAHRFKKILKGLFQGDADGRRLLANLILALLPAVVIGLMLEGPIKKYLFGTYPVIAAWFVGGGVILFISFYFKTRHRDLHQGKEIEDIGPKVAIFIGVAQCLAMWPGVSRSLATILGGLFLGFSMKATVEFSFLLGAVTLTAASAYDVLKHGSDMLAVLEIRSMVLGLVFAFAAAVLSVKWMIHYLNKYGLEIFGYYRIVLAVATAWIYLK
ncbi:MAG: undecaprenyl-diphosphate phosphatase [Deltaproteobacteria bacterium]|nr:MAG: undecaprenyl-diphosphate phosphatase [Deltaproteobacteria bacterium]